MRRPLPTSLVLHLQLTTAVKWPREGRRGRARRRAPVARTGEGAAQTSCVAVVQVVVRHGWPERYADGLGSMLEKPTPRIVTVAALETWMFTGAKEETQVAVTYVGYAARRVVPQAA